ncbi:MAG: putative porin [Proteobacteria bacterium]|nr:putative porin [Pseudomonadota bacterium]MBU1389910.1 putative porin [Pseudomonadota bacterium]MBU1543919.1 putative porin [Pseudomonadota bacterium]MBU2429652.1 putative porin [Pseudomonadota bacterium]MBU2481976.1 putative porin [Pseudomonadota bacterium]
MRNLIKAGQNPGTTLKSISVCVFMFLVWIGFLFGTYAYADELKQPSAPVNTGTVDTGTVDSTEALIDLLKKKGLINESEAKGFLELHRQKIRETGQVITITSPDDQEEYLKGVSKQVTEKLTKDLNDLKDNYDFRTEDLIRRSILLEREIDRLEEVMTEEYKPQLQESSWAQRIRFGGDIRLRHESVLYDKKNARDILDPSNPPTQYKTNYINSTNDEHRQRIRLRVSANAKIIDPSDVNMGKVIAGVRLATGSVDNPVSTNHTLGHADKDNASVILDRAWVNWTYRPEEELMGKLMLIPEVSLTGGIMENPWMASNLVFDSDLGFEGVTLGLKTDTNPMNSFSGFLTLGYFPLEESERSQKDKYMIGAQAGFKHRPAYGWEYMLAAAIYDYKNIDGTAVTHITRTAQDEIDLEFMSPKYLQKGNSWFDMDQTQKKIDGVTDNHDVSPGLLSEFRILNISGQLDNSLFFPIQISLYWDWAKNLGYDPQKMGDKIGQSKAVIEADSGDIGYQAGLKVGYLKPRELWDWNLFVEYRYIESDAVLDAFTDSDFHGGGTNAKGFIFGGELGLYHNVWLNARWMSANEIDDMQHGTLPAQKDDLAIDTFQFSINTSF